jgi:gamma-glutamylcyclotransferase (GGCT)/AIG2-like uncharacterized protein YtfP
MPVGAPVSATRRSSSTDGSAIRVHVFESMQLPDHWSRLDEFEGPGYQRVVTSVSTAAGEVNASIYVLRAYLESSDG